MQKLAAAAQSCSIKRVTILNTYSWLNKGDAAIVLGTAHVLREINSDVAITIVSQTPKIDRLRYKEHGIHVVAGPFGLIYEQDTAKVWRLILFIVSFSGLVLGMILTRVLGRSAVGWLPGETGRLAQSITSVDIIISCGGGFWHDSDGGRGIRLHLLQIVCPLIAGVPVICLGQSLGPFQNDRRLQLVGKVLSRTKAVILRETESLPIAHAMKIPRERLYVSTDMAFALGQRTAKMKTEQKPADTLRIGVTARSWWFPNSVDPKQVQARYEQALASVLSTLLERSDTEVVFLPQVIGPSSDDDRVVERRIAKHLGQSARVSVLEQDMSPQELITYIGDLHLVIATRFHSAIFTMLAQVPVIAIAYEHKTTGIMRQMGLDHWVIPIEQVTASHLLHLCITIDQEYDEIKEHLRKAVEQANRDACDSLALCISDTPGLSVMVNASEKLQ